MAQVKSSSVTVAGHPCRVLEAGAGSPVVYLAGIGGLPKWSPFLDALSTTHRVIAPSLPGFPGAPDFRHLDDYHEWVVATLELLEACFPAMRNDFYSRESIGQLHYVIRNYAVAVDLVAYADANADIRYVAYGNDIAAGIDGRETDAEVARSNDTKGPCGPDGKVSKGPTYSPPDIAGVLKDQGWKP